MNQFLECGCDHPVTLPALCSSFDVHLAPKQSQVFALLFVPNGLAGPSDWTSATAVEGIVDNTVTDNSAAKVLIGRGGVDEPEEVIVTTGKTAQKVAKRIYTMQFELSPRTSQQYAFVRKFQKNYTAFSFWFATLGDRLLGGAQGIKPHLVSAAFPYDATDDSPERAVLRIVWHADGDPDRTTINDLFNDITEGGGGSTSSIMFYHQSFASQVSATLSWTENSGVLPSSNTKAQVLVFQEGQKLEEIVQYTITGSSIVIDASTHWTGANYEVLAVITS